MTALVRSIRGMAERERSRFLVDHHVKGHDKGTLLWELTCIGSGLTFIGSRALTPSRRDPDTTPVPPGRPHSGPGSADSNISDHATEHADGSAAQGMPVWWSVPDQLRGVHNAPVVVYLHGFRGHGGATVVHEIDPDATGSGATRSKLGIEPWPRDDLSRRQIPEHIHIVLVRPDGHIGWTRPIDEAERLGAHMDRWLVRTPG